MAARSNEGESVLRLLKGRLLEFEQALVHVEIMASHRHGEFHLQAKAFRGGRMRLATKLAITWPEED